MAEKSIQLNFEGYWREGTLSLIPPHSGVFCVYECGPGDEGDRADIRRLLFIGEVPDVQSAIADNECWDDLPESITISNLDAATATWIDEQAKLRGTNVDCRYRPAASHGNSRL